jgi:YbgC/YbaW family acyl-CoA thioester hydrolase
MRATLADAGPADRVPPFRFSARSRVDVADTDLGAVVYYGRYPVHLDRAVLAYRRHLGIPPLGPEGHLFVVRSLTIDYLSSARFDEEVEVFVRTSAVGRSSHTMELRMERLAGGPAGVAEARMVIVGLAAYGGRPSRMPDDMRRAIEGFEGPGPP